MSEHTGIDAVGGDETKSTLVSRRGVLQLSAVGAGALALTPKLRDLSGVKSLRPHASSPKSGGTLTFGRNTGPTQLDPANSIVQGDVYTLDKIFEPLYITSPAGDLTPWLAESHSVSADGKTWIFKLRPGVEFSDGKALTAEDVVFSINRARKDANGPLSFLDSAIKSIVATNASTVTFELTQVWAPFLSDISVFANAILPSNFGGKSEAAFFAKPVGTGPFLLESFVKGANVTLKKNPKYWQKGKPYLDEVNFTYVASDNQRVAQLKGGQIDIAAQIPPQQVASLKSDSSLAVKEFGSWAVDLIFFNEKRPYFKDRNVRRAINYAIDIPALAKATTYGTAKPGGSFFPPSLQYYASVPTLNHNLAKAKVALKASGYPKGFSFKLLVDSGNSQYVSAATIIQQELAPLNIKVTIDQQDNATYTAQFEAFNYDAMINGATNDISDPDEMASFQVDVQDGGSHSFWTYYDNPAAIKLVREAEVATDDATRKSLYKQIQAIVAQDAPFIALDYPPNIYGWSTKVNGFAVNPGGAYRLEDVWLS